MSLISDFISLFFPRSCYVCGNSLYKNEEVLCTRCNLHLPETNYHKMPDNPIHKIFWGKIPVVNASAMYFFKKGGSVQRLVHQLKYKGHLEIGTLLGQNYGHKLKQEERYKDIGLIIPIPLHPKKLRIRGFNQAEVFAGGIAGSMHVQLNSSAIKRVVATSTQTKKSRYKRWENVSGIFEITDSAVLENKHILLVDDVITTGSTMEACLTQLNTIPGIRLSVAAIACAVR